MKTNRLYLRLTIMAGLLCGMGAVGQAATKPAPAKANVPAMSPEKIEARRKALAKIIAQEQEIMDAYDKQNSFKPGDKISATKYEKAKAARDKAQAERDGLAN